VKIVAIGFAETKYAQSFHVGMAGLVPAIPIKNAQCIAGGDARHKLAAGPA
jgi:hypothetical protein